MGGNIESMSIARNEGHLLELVIEYDSDGVIRSLEIYFPSSRVFVGDTLYCHIVDYPKKALVIQIIY